MAEALVKHHVLFTRDSCDQNTGALGDCREATAHVVGEMMKMLHAFEKAVP